MNYQNLLLRENKMTEKQIYLSDKKDEQREFKEIIHSLRGLVLNEKSEVLIERLTKYKLYTLPGGTMYHEP